MASQATGTIFVNEAFTDTAGTELSAHDADWNNIGGADSLGISDANRVRILSATFGVGYYNNTTTPPSAEYDVRADVRVLTNESGGSAGVFARMASDQSSYYLVVYNQATGAWELQDQLGAIASYSQSLSASTTYALEMRIRDSEKQVLIDGVSRISDASNDATGANTVGVYEVSAAGNNTTGYHLDNFVAQDVTGGATATRYRAIIGMCLALGLLTAPSLARWLMLVWERG